MDYRRANRTFLYMVISSIMFAMLYTMWYLFVGTEMSVVLNNVMSELVILIPALAVVLFSGERLGVLIPLKPIRITSALLVLLYVALLYPLVTFVNSVSMLFVDNTILEMSEQIVGTPMWKIILSVGIAGPFIEEIIFRGILLQSYQRTGRIIGSILLSSVLFGLMHLNFNQFAYGTVMGIMMALLVEATGSVIASFLAHAIFNSFEVLLVYQTSGLLDGAGDYIDSFTQPGQLLITIGVLFVLSVIGTGIALCVVYKISEIEGRKEFFSSIFRIRSEGPHLITVPLVVTIVVAFGYMVLLEVISTA